MCWQNPVVLPFKWMNKWINEWINEINEKMNKWINETSLTDFLHSAIHFLGFNKKKFKNFAIFFPNWS